MSQKQYLKNVEKEIQRINRLIDQKIMRGEEYSKEARDHKLLLRKIRFCRRQNFLQSLSQKFSPRLRRSFGGQAKFAIF